MKEIFESKFSTTYRERTDSFAKAVLAIALALLLAGCATPVNRSPDRAFRPLPDNPKKSTVYVVKPYDGAMCGGAPLDRSVPITVPGKAVVRIDCEQYAVFVFDPGETTIEIKGVRTIEGINVPLDVRLEAGKEYALKIMWSRGGFLFYRFGYFSPEAFKNTYRIHDEDAL
jgi:hypothetical protein